MHEQKAVMQMKDVTILVAEEDPATLQFLADNLDADGFEVYTASTLGHAVVLLGRGPDLLLVDVNGATLGLVEQLRGGEIPGADSAIPIFVLSSKSQDELHMLRAFERGTDDYLRKPFSYAELRARLGAMLRRSSRQCNVVRAGALTLNVTSRTAAIEGEPVELSNKEFTLLRALATEPTRVFTKEELLRDVWGFQARGTTRTLDSHACRLRTKLGVKGHRYIVNVWGVGYRLVDQL